MSQEAESDADTSEGTRHVLIGNALDYVMRCALPLMGAGEGMEYGISSSAGRQNYAMGT